jgi:hypothetical protein
MQQLQGTITLETNFIHIYVLKYIFLSSNILSISLSIPSWKVRNLNKSNVLTTTESINRTLKKKCWVNNLKNMGIIGTQFRKSRKILLLRNPRVNNWHYIECVPWSCWHLGKFLNVQLQCCQWQAKIISQYNIQSDTCDSKLVTQLKSDSTR